MPSSRNEIKKYSSLLMSKQLKPFKSDKCSHWPNGTKKNPHLWSNCCHGHDLAYWMGGTRLDRKTADDLLYRCVEKVAGLDTAEIMFTGVRSFGGPDYDTEFKWAYGWNYPRGYLPLTEKEKAYIKSLGY